MVKEDHLPVGHKKTELGTIPDEWDFDALEKFWSVTDCKHITAKFVPMGFPVASIRETQARLVDLSEASQTTEAYYIKLIEGGRKPRPGDLIFSRNATVGEVAQVTDQHPLFAMGQDVCLLRKRSDKQSTDFLQCFLKSQLTGRQLDEFMVGSTFKRVNVQQIKSLLVTMPKESEQHAIAAALSDADALIASLDALIAKKRDLKQAAMQQLLSGKTRLPGFKGEWEVKQLGSVAEFYKGKGLPKSAISSSGRFPCIHYGELFTFYGASIVDVASRTDFEFGAFWSKQNDVLMPTSDVTPTGLAKASCLKSEGIVLGGDILVIRAEEHVLNGVFLALQIRYHFDQIMKLVSGSTVYHLYASDMRKFEFLLPSIEEQSIVVSFLCDMDADLAALEAKRDKARAIKQGMMQELLTGRIRLV